MTAALVVAACLLATDLAHHDNFAPNPSFEGDRDRDTRPDGWEGNAFLSAGLAEWDRSVARTGKASFRLSDPGRSDSKDWKRSVVRWSSAELPVQPGTEYSLEVWVKTKDVTGKARVLLSWQDDHRWIDQASSEAVSGTSDWQKLTVSATAPDKANMLRITLDFGYGSGTVWFDDVKVSGRSTLQPEVTYVFHDTEDWFPFEFPDDDTNLDTIDLTFLLDAPAGKRGFVGVRPDGHFYFEDGSRARFFGTNIGARRLHHWGAGMHALSIAGGELVEVARNVTDSTWGAGIWVFVGGDYSRGEVERPLIRSLIHHNKVTNSLLGLQDYGGVASWMAGPSYVNNNISGNAVGYKHPNWRGLDRRDWYRTSCYGVALYIDGQYKGYVFNNILWGNNNDGNDRFYNSSGFNEAMGFLNTVFNNTIFRVGVGLHKGMTQHNRSYYLGNLMLDIGHKFIQQEPHNDVIEHDTLAWTGNVFNGTPPNFGQLGSGVFPTLDQWQAAMSERRALVADAGALASEPQTLDAETHDFRLRPGADAIDHAPKVFVPWALYAVVGEWGFYRHPADPTLVLGENINWNREWYERTMIQDIPRNDLVGHGIDASNFVVGTLENWTEGAMTFDGRNEFCVLRVSRGTLADAETTIEELYEWEFNGPFLKDFQGRKTSGKGRDAGALEYAKEMESK